MKTFTIYTFILLLNFSCIRIQDFPPDLPITFLNSNGVFIINEGNFRLGNGSLSFFSYDSARIYNDIFNKINNRILGDVPNSIEIFGNRAYIIVNNSGNIEVVEKNTLLSVQTITGLVSPRQIAIVNNEKAYVTSMYSDSVAIIELNENSISGYINIRRTSESIVVVGQKAFISEWIGGKDVMVINTVNDKVVDSIEVAKEPESMVVDNNNIIWVLCNGGWQRNNYAELVGLNAATSEIYKRFIFPDILASPSCLQINGRGDTLYYLDSGVRVLSVFDSELPKTTLIEENGSYFYKLGINPVNSDIFITDALDYQQKGLILQYSCNGTILSQYQTDVIPGKMLFKIRKNNDPVIGNIFK